jgi:hypothetical protein
MASLERFHFVRATTDRISQKEKPLWEIFAVCRDKKHVFGHEKNRALKDNESPFRNAEIPGNFGHGEHCATGRGEHVRQPIDLHTLGQVLTTFVRCESLQCY